jgi:hypothetical protein
MKKGIPESCCLTLLAAACRRLRNAGEPSKGLNLDYLLLVPAFKISVP